MKIVYGSIFQATKNKIWTPAILSIKQSPPHPSYTDVARNGGSYSKNNMTCKSDYPLLTQIKNVGKNINSRPNPFSLQPHKMV